MALGPEQAAKNRTAEIANEIQTHEKYIDEKLVKEYHGQSTFEVFFTGSLHQKVKEGLSAIYKKAGWGTVSFTSSPARQGSDTKLILNKFAPKHPKD